MQCFNFFDKTLSSCSSISLFAIQSFVIEVFALKYAQLPEVPGSVAGRCPPCIYMTNVEEAKLSVSLFYIRVQVPTSGAACVSESASHVLGSALFSFLLFLAFVK